MGDFAKRLLLSVRGEGLLKRFLFKHMRHRNGFMLICNL